MKYLRTENPESAFSVALTSVLAELVVRDIMPSRMADVIAEEVGRRVNHLVGGGYIGVSDSPDDDEQTIFVPAEAVDDVDPAKVELIDVYTGMADDEAENGQKDEE